MSDMVDDEDNTSGLGRGLNALFADDEDDFSVDMPDDDDEEGDSIRIEDVLDAEEEEITAAEALSLIAAVEDDIVSQPEDVRVRNRVGVEQLFPGKFQPRRIFSEDSIDELADSIRQYGVLQPLLVRADSTREGMYEIIAGERRWRASQKAQLHDVPVIVLELEELEAFKIALIENLQREDLDPIDEALGYQKLLEDFDQTQDDLSKAVGKSRPHITNMIRLLSLPDEVQGHLSAGDISMGHARALITAENPSELVKRVISKGLSVRQTEKFASNTRAAPNKAKAPIPVVVVEKDADTTALENDISNALGMRVSIDSNDGKTGKLSVEFKSLDQLDEILHRLAHFPGSRLSG